jgi:uncharacterized protein YjbI with pentapeptide repeats
MANEEHLNLLKQDIKIWNQWREINWTIQPDLIEADLSFMDLSGANLRRVNLSRANLVGSDLSGSDLCRACLIEADLSMSDLTGAYLTGAYLSGADLSMTDLSLADLSHADLRNTDLSGADLVDAKLIDTNLNRSNFNRANLFVANLSRANLGRTNLSKTNLRRACLREAYLCKAEIYDADLSLADLSDADLRNVNLSKTNLVEVNLSRADLRNANLSKVNLSKANLRDANLRGAVLQETQLVRANLQYADLSGSHIYGISAWDLNLENTTQKDLVITPKDELAITVDNLEIAQFIYLLLHNKKIRHMITVTSKAVLILGRFTRERKAVLDALREELRRYDYVPILVDFDKPTDRDFIETIMTLAGMSNFVIVDITNPKSSPLELQATVPDYMIPLVPIIEQGELPFSMFADIEGKYEWVLNTLEYDSVENLIQLLEPAVIEPALLKYNELMLQKAQQRCRAFYACK